MKNFVLSRTMLHQQNLLYEGPLYRGLLYFEVRNIQVQLLLRQVQ